MKTPSPHPAAALDRSECVACGAPTHPFAALEERLFGVGTTHPYVRCEACETVQIGRLPGDVAALYPPAYYSQSSEGPVPSWFFTMDGAIGPALTDALLGARPAGDPAVASDLRALAARAVQLYLPQLDADHRVLEVGCGDGSFLRALKALGVRHTEGLDPYVTAPDVRRIELDERVGPPADRILLQHTLEHVPDPRALLEALHAHLAAAGRVLIRIPLVDNELVSEHGVAWAGFEPPRHFTLFSERGFRSLSSTTGWRIVRSAREENVWSVLGTWQWARGIPLTDPRSVFVRPDTPIFDPFDRVDARQLAAAHNLAGTGDQGWFVLESNRGLSAPENGV